MTRRCRATTCRLAPTDQDCNTTCCISERHTASRDRPRYSATNQVEHHTPGRRDFRRQRIPVAQLARMLRFLERRQESHERMETRLSKIESILHETRQFAPPAALEKTATISGMPAYRALVAEAEQDYEGFWAR
ncbi:acetyl-coenzyme A synthetase, partial [Burkholderia orbicola]|nr:acetyl-coenzyme A synthetase [Burkholderia orbicola]